MFDNEEFEETIAQLEAVEAARVVRKGGRIVELHVLAAQSKSPKQVARDIQSLAMARYGVNVDRRVISVVQLAADSIKQRTLQRPALVRIREQTDNTRTTLTVTLAWQNGEQRCTLWNRSLRTLRPSHWIPSELQVSACALH